MFKPLARLLFGLCLGLLLANILEALRWSRALAKITAPLARLAHLGHVSGSAFALAFVSPAAANALLSEHYERHDISMRELVLANLFNSLPSFLAHTPTIFFLIWPVLGFSALVYVGLTLVAALARTACIVMAGRFFLPRTAGCPRPFSSHAPEHGGTRHAAFATAWKRFRRRMPRLICFTAPIYILTYICQQCGFFQMAEQWLAGHLQWAAFIKPQAMSVIVLQIVAEMGATLGACGAILREGALSGHDIVAALLAGNLLSTPMRAIRHQFPSYAGFYKPVLAMKLILANQAMRAASILGVLAVYVLCL